MQKLWEKRRVTVFLTEFVLLRVLAFEMKDVNWESNALECGIILDVFGESAIIIIENKIGHARELKGPLDHFLTMKYEPWWQEKSIHREELTTTVGITSAP